MIPSKRGRVRKVLLVTALVGVVSVPFQACERSNQVPPGWTARNMEPVGYSDLDGRGGAFKMAIKQVNARWYLYLGHLWHRGWTIVDVTDPTNPTVVKFIPGPDNTWTIQMTLHDDLMLTALQRISEAWGGDPSKPNEEGVLLWDISDPVNPQQLSHWKTGAGGTHRNIYPGGQYAYLSASKPGYLGRILVILDVSDPSNPREAGSWWMPGQHEAAGETPALQEAPHGPPVVEGDTLYLGYGPAVVILDISDVSTPKLIGRLDLSPPFKTQVHGVLPIPGKDLLFANSEAIAESCDDEPLNHATLIDIADPTAPRLVSVFPLPVPPPDEAYTSFCDKGGRFGPHNFSNEYHLPDVQEQGDLFYLTYFNAGLRVFDISEPRLPKEVGWFIPPTPPTRLGPIPVSALVTQTEDVLVDTRGNIYITDKQWGLWILRNTDADDAPP